MWREKAINSRKQGEAMRIDFMPRSHLSLVLQDDLKFTYELEESVGHEVI